MIYLKLFFLAIVVVFIIDLSGIIDTIKTFLLIKIFKINAEPQNLSLKPFDCSLCSFWWLGLIYLLCTKNLNLQNIAYIAIISYLTPNIAGFISLLKEILIKIENKIYDKIYRRTNEGA